MKQIHWGILGCGEVAERKSGPAFNKVEGSRVFAVMRRNDGKARDFAKRHNIPNWYSSADKLINHSEIDAIYIATPPSSHADYAIQAMEKGKAVYVEKPMAADYSDCERMLMASKATGRPLYVAYYRRFLPYFMKVKEILDKGLLGDLLYAKIDFHVPPRDEDFNADELPWRVKPEISGGGYFYDMACHQLDLFDWYFGQVAEVKGICMNRRGLYKAEDYVHADIIYESGLPVTGTWCFAGDGSKQNDNITIFGTDAVLEFSAFKFTPIRLLKVSGEQEYLPANPENIQYWFIKNMVEELQGQRPVDVNITSAMRTNYIMDKILGKL